MAVHLSGRQRDFLVTLFPGRPVTAGRYPILLVQNRWVFTTFPIRTQEYYLEQKWFNCRLGRMRIRLPSLRRGRQSNAFRFRPYRMPCIGSRLLLPDRHRQRLNKPKRRYSDAESSDICIVLSAILMALSDRVVPTRNTVLSMP